MIRLGGHTELLSAPTVKSFGSHDSCHAVFSDFDPALSQFPCDSWASVAPLSLLLDPFDFATKLLVTPLPIRYPVCSPPEISTA